MYVCVRSEKDIISLYNVSLYGLFVSYDNYYIIFIFIMYLKVYYPYQVFITLAP